MNNFLWSISYLEYIFCVGITIQYLWIVLFIVYEEISIVKIIFSFQLKMKHDFVQIVLKNEIFNALSLGIISRLYDDVNKMAVEVLLISYNLWAWHDDLYVRSKERFLQTQLIISSGSGFSRELSRNISNGNCSLFNHFIFVTLKEFYSRS